MQPPTTTHLRGAALLVLHEEGLAATFVSDVLDRLRRTGLVAAAHALSPEARDSDRRAMPELDRALDALRRQPGIDGARLGVLGFGRGGTLAFLLGCTRSVAAVVDVEGPVLYPELTPARPTQPLELALNFEGALLGVFAREGAVKAEERELLAGRLAAAARPCELVVLAGAGESFFDLWPRGYDGARAEELWRPVLAFLHRSLAAESDPDPT